MTHDSVNPVLSPVARARNDQCAVLMVFLWLLMAMVVAPVVVSARSSSDVPEPAKEMVDANSAPWWELAALPRIGIGLSHRIVEYRESAGGDASERSDRRAFTCPADLARVRGIGPKTTQRIGRHLSFGRG